MKDIQIGKEEVKPFLVIDDIMIHVENAKTHAPPPRQMLLELIS